MPLFTITGGSAATPLPTVSGGTLYSDSTYYYRKFTSSGTLTVTGGTLACDVLAIGGGGAGGLNPVSAGYYAGAGGAGGVTWATDALLKAGSISVVVGAGGSTGTALGDSRGNIGGISYVGNLAVAAGGGGGGGGGDAKKYIQYQCGRDGASGGGGQSEYNSSIDLGGGVGGKAISGQGNIGGNGSGVFQSNPQAGGGGGGASAAGQNASNFGSNGGNGGAGTSSYSTIGSVTSSGQNVSGTYYFAGGGGGASNTTPGTGGNGGGGAGGAAAGSAGTANTGGGAGNGQAGGSGIVIVRYLKTAVA